MRTACAECSGQSMAVVHHYVHVSAALAATGPGPGTSSIYAGTPVAGPLSTGPIVTIVSADEASRAAATTAAALWNSYYSSSPLAPAQVTTAVVDSFPGSTTVGLASGVVCPDTDPRHLCGTVELSVLRGWELLFVDIFFHEIGHAVIYSGATAPGRSLDGGHHWSPYEPSEIFGPYIAAEPWVADYTVGAAGPGARCGPVPPNFRRVPTCAAPSPAPRAPSTTLVRSSSDNTAAIAGAAVGGTVAALILVAIVTTAGKPPTPTSSRFADAPI